MYMKSVAAATPNCIAMCLHIEPKRKAAAAAMCNHKKHLHRILFFATLCNEGTPNSDSEHGSYIHTTPCFPMHRHALRLTSWLQSLS